MDDETLKKLLQDMVASRRFVRPSDYAIYAFLTGTATEEEREAVTQAMMASKEFVDEINELAHQMFGEPTRASFASRVKARFRKLFRSEMLARVAASPAFKPALAAMIVVVVAAIVYFGFLQPELSIDVAIIGLSEAERAAVRIVDLETVPRGGSAAGPTVILSQLERMAILKVPALWNGIVPAAVEIRDRSEHSLWSMPLERPLAPPGDVYLKVNTTSFAPGIYIVILRDRSNSELARYLFAVEDDGGAMLLPDKIEERLLDLRYAGAYLAALDLSERFAAEADTPGRFADYVVADADCWVSTYKLIQGLSQPDKTALKLADMRSAEIDSLFNVQQFEEAAALQSEILLVKSRLLGEHNLETAKALSALSFLLNEGENQNPAQTDSLHRLTIERVRSIAGDAHPLVSEALTNYAYFLETIKGEYTLAEVCYREALAIDEEVYNDPDEDIAIDQNNLGDLLMKQGRYLDAKDVLEKCLTARRRLYRPDSPEVLQAINNLAMDYYYMSRYSAADSLYNEVLKAYRNNEEYDEIYAKALNNAGLNRCSVGDYGAAEAMFKEAVVRKTILYPDDPSKLAPTYTNLGDLYFVRGDLDESLRYHNLALEADLAVLPQTHPDISKDFNYIARTLLALNRVAEAETLLEASAKIFEDARMKASGSRLSDARFSSEYSPYAWLAVARLKTGKEFAAWESAEKDRGRVMLDLLAVRGGMEIAKPHSLELIQNALEPASAIIGWLDIDHWHYAYLVPKSGPVKWANLGNSAIREEAKRFVGLLSRNGQATDTWFDLGRSLFASRVGPFFSELSHLNRVCVIASGDMVGVPVEALPFTEDSLVIDRWKVSYVSSATALPWMNGRAANRMTNALLAFGDPPFNAAQARDIGRAKELGESGAEKTSRMARSCAQDEGEPRSLSELDRLAGTGREVRQIAVLFEDKTVLTGLDATEQAAMNLANTGRLSEYGYIHFATHAFTNDVQAEHSFIVLSQVGLSDPTTYVVEGKPVIDGKLTMQEVASGWTLNAQLVTVSACESGLGPVTAGEGYIGFAHAFLKAGARSVVVSLWPVDDRATELLMVRFYSNMVSNNITKSEALTEAKLWLRSLKTETGELTFSHPAYWAGFVLIGSAN